MFNIYLNGLCTGLLLQIAIGPVFFLIMNTTIQRSVRDGFISVIAVTIIDYLYIFFAVIGVGALLRKEKIKRILGITGSLILVLFGSKILIHMGSSGNMEATGILPHGHYIVSFSNALILTASNPLTIIFWTGLFAVKAAELNYDKARLVHFGIAAGLATLLFLGSAVLLFSLIKDFIPNSLVRILNVVVGFVFVTYGITRFISTVKRKSFKRK